MLFSILLFFFFKVLNLRSSDLNLQPASGDLILSFEFFMLLTLPLPHSYLSSSHASCLSGIPLYLDSSETLRDDVSGEAWFLSCFQSHPSPQWCPFLRSHCRSWCWSTATYTSPLPGCYSWTFEFSSLKDVKHWCSANVAVLFVSLTFISDTVAISVGSEF